MTTVAKFNIFVIHITYFSLILSHYLRPLGFDITLLHAPSPPAEMAPTLRLYHPFYCHWQASIWLPLSAVVNHKGYAFPDGIIQFAGGGVIGGR